MQHHKSSWSPLEVEPSLGFDIFFGFTFETTLTKLRHGALKRQRQLFTATNSLDLLRCDVSGWQQRERRSWGKNYNVGKEEKLAKSSVVSIALNSSDQVTMERDLSRVSKSRDSYALSLLGCPTLNLPRQLPQFVFYLFPYISHLNKYKFFSPHPVSHGKNLTTSALAVTSWLSSEKPVQGKFREIATHELSTSFPEMDLLVLISRSLFFLSLATCSV